MLYLKAAIWVLEEKSDRAIVHVLPTPQLAWQDVVLGREGRIVEQPESCKIVNPTLHLCMRLEKQLRILGISSLQNIIRQW